MQELWTFLVLVAAAINLAPVLGAGSKVGIVALAGAGLVHALWLRTVAV